MPRRLLLKILFFFSLYFFIALRKLNFEYQPNNVVTKLEYYVLMTSNELRIHKTFQIIFWHILGKQYDVYIQAYSSLDSDSILS